MYSFALLLFRFLVPAIIVAMALWLRVWLPSLDAESRILVGRLPYLFCLIALLMALQFNRCRLLLAALGVAAVYWFVQNYLQDSLSNPAVASSYLSLSLAVPLTYLYLLVVPERGVANLFGLLSVAGFALLGLLVVWFAPLLPTLNDAATRYYAPWPGEAYVLSRGATALFGLSMLAAVSLLVLRKEESEAALLGALVALFTLLAFLYLPAISVAIGTGASLCLLWGALRSSHAMAYRDELTGLPGRRALNERMKTLSRRYVIAMADIDHFKHFNDTHGHDVGDQVLRLVASRLRRVRGGTAYRYGGEEFCIVFARRSLEDCIEPVEEIRRNIAAYRMHIRDRNLRPQRQQEGVRRRGATRLRSDQVAVTVSVGLAEHSADTANAEDVLKAADHKLYQAKRAGRNRVAW